MSVRIRYKTEKGVQRTPVDFSVDVPAEMLYRLVHSIREELQDPESIRNWEAIATMFTRLIMTLKMQQQFGMQPPRFFPAGSPVPIKSIEDIKKFLETALGEIDDKQHFDEIFKEDQAIPDEIKKEKYKNFKSVKVEDPEDKNKSKDEEDKK